MSLLLSHGYFLKDDHDTLKNDAWPGQKYGDLTWDQGVALFREQFPLGDKTYRTVRWGKDLQVWMVEGGTPNTLLRRGLTRESIPVGALIVVDGYQSKDRSARANGRDITFADGRKFFMGSSGTGAPHDGRDATEQN